MRDPWLTASLVISTAAAMLTSACSSPIVDDERAGVIECDNLDQSSCIFPFPTDYYRTFVDGKASLRFPDGSLPHRSVFDVDPTGYQSKRGYSVISPILFRLPGATLEGATPWNDIDASLSPSSSTVIVDAESGELMAHWAEFDAFSLMEFPNHPDAPDEVQPVIALRLARRLQASRRYVVGVHGMVGEDGRPVQALPGFKPLRDREPSTFLGVGQRRDHFEEHVFPVLEKAGVARASLQLAWDFTTDDESTVTGTLLAMRDALFEALGDDGPEYGSLTVEENPNERIARIVKGVAKVPSFLEGRRGQIQRIRRDAEGRPVHQGFEDVPFELQIPKAIWEGDSPGLPLQYGHGLLGSGREARTRWIGELANEAGLVILATDMTGMAEEDMAIWMGVLLGDLSNLPYLSEKPHQGIINHLALVRMLKGAFANDPLVVRADGGPAYDPARVVYNGNSQGGTMGGVMMPIQTDITVGVLGVPGGAFSLLLTRTNNWAELAGDMIRNFADNLADYSAVMGLLQLGFDPIDAVNYMHRLSGDTFPGTPDHRVLLASAREDAQVHNQVTDLIARTAGARLLVPSRRDVWGLETSEGPVDGSAMIEYDFLRPAFPNEPVPGRYDTHACIAWVPAAREQMKHFFHHGEAKNFCEGACVSTEEWNEAHCRIRN